MVQIVFVGEEGELGVFVCFGLGSGLVFCLFMGFFFFYDIRDYESYR